MGGGEVGHRFPQIGRQTGCGLEGAFRKLNVGLSAVGAAQKPQRRVHMGTGVERFTPHLLKPSATEATLTSSRAWPRSARTQPPASPPSVSNRISRPTPVPRPCLNVIPYRSSQTQTVN